MTPILAGHQAAVVAAEKCAGPARRRGLAPALEPARLTTSTGSPAA